MNRQGYIFSMMVAGTVFAGMSAIGASKGAEQLASEAAESISIASEAVQEARVAIESGKQLISLIPADSMMSEEVTEMLRAAAQNWTLAVDALEGAKESAAKISTASSQGIAQDYKLLATVNAGVALSGAQVVQTGVLFIDAAANNKTESLEIIRVAMQDSLAAAAQVQFNYERVKSLIADKYLK